MRSGLCARFYATMGRTDRRTHMAHKAEHAVDLETGTVVGVAVPGADTGDTMTMVETVIGVGRAGRGGVADRGAGCGAAGGQGLPQQRDDG